MKGAANSNWKGGRVRGGHKNRYWMVHAPDHPNASKSGYVLEHRLVMEAVVGRYLREGEVVHHRNGDPSDNRPENLEVLSQSHHARLHYDEHLRPHGYVRPPAEIAVGICERCGSEFTMRGKKQAGKRFCSFRCYQDSRLEREFCKNGHRWTPENTYVPPSGKGRDCRACTRERWRQKGEAA